MDRRSFRNAIKNIWKSHPKYDINIANYKKYVCIMAGGTKERGIQMSWSQNEMELLYKEMQKKAMTDEKFRKELLKDPNGALEKLAGKKLPEGCNIKVIENDPAYTATFVLPDLISEELTPDEMDGAAGGISVLLIVSACGAAVAAGPCAGDACGAQGCISDSVCAGKACGARGATL